MSDSQNKQIPQKLDPVMLAKNLRAIARARTRLVVFLWTLPVYVVAIWVLLNNGRSINAMVWIYMIVYAGFAIDMAKRNCPNCHKQFYVKKTFLNLIARDCLHCGLTSNPQESVSKE